MNYISFKLVKDSLDIESVAKYLGLDVKNHMCCCLFHNDKTPSMRLYTDHFYCFGCGSSGDVIKLAAEVLHVKPFDTVLILNDAFKLGLDFKEISAYKKTRYPTQLILKQQDYEDWYRLAVLILSIYIQCCYAVMNFSDHFEWQFEMAKSEAEHTEFIQDSMFEKSPLKAFEYREEVNKIDRKLQRSFNLSDGTGKQYIRSHTME
ncbi:MAG: CHC2 zinc finger domain-containing protein [Bacilli bacterium]|nr:CHC2 zinc finger domain-containing protein [Bacilli bacterium]